MANTLTIQQLTTAKTMITRGDLVGFYNYMYNQGYGYANLAKGVVECSYSSGGASALQYMTDVAKKAGITLTTQQIAKIEINMATGYVDTLLETANKSPTKTVNADIDGYQALQFHNDVFDKNGLPRECWTLYIPSKYLSKEEFNARFASTIDPQNPALPVDTATLLWNSGRWAWEMVLKTNAYEAAYAIGFNLPENAKAISEINDWIWSITRGTPSAWSSKNGFTDPITACQSGVQNAIYQLQKDAVTNTATNPATQPTDTSTRVSSNFITDAYANDHLIIIKAGGSVWDAYALQANKVGGISEWKDFQTAILVCNPQITNLNKVAAGTTLYLPEKQANGSTTYHYASGASINSSAATGEYFMVIPNQIGGQTIYSRTVDGSNCYTIHTTITTDVTGEIITDYLGTQATPDSDITWAESQTTTVISVGVTETAIDTNADSHIDTDTLTTASGNYDLLNFDSRNDAEYLLSSLYEEGTLGQNYWSSFTNQSANMCLIDGSFVPSGIGSGDGWLDPIGAFYDSQSPGFDNANSIATSTPALLDASNRALSQTQLIALDTKA